MHSSMGRKFLWNNLQVLKILFILNLSAKYTSLSMA
jgi:hypothetical protein